MRTEKFNSIFEKYKPAIGMIHVPALPGTPKFINDFQSSIDKCLSEARTYLDNGIENLMIENMHDVPYLNRKVGPEIVSAMSIIGHEIKSKFNCVCGIQILAGANKEALAVAKTANLDFIRSEGFVFSHIADEGIMSSDAGEILRYRRNIDAENVAVFTDIKKKHSSHSITNDLDITETVHAAEFFLSDGVIITGKSTGKEADLEELSNVYKSSKLPVIVGSGLTTENLSRFFKFVDAFIIGSYFKTDGNWQNDLDINRIRKFSNKLDGLRKAETK